MTDNEHRPPEPPQGRDPGREPDDRSRQTTLNGVPVPSSNMNDLRELKKAQTMVMVASVARSTRDDGKRRLRGSCDGCRDRCCRIDLDLGINLSAVETA